MFRYHSWLPQYNITTVIISPPFFPNTHTQPRVDARVLATHHQCQLAQVMTKDERARIVKLELCDFSAINAHLLSESEARKSATKEDKEVRLSITHNLRQWCVCVCGWGGAGIWTKRGVGVMM